MEKNLDHEFDEYLKAHESEILRAIPDFLKRLESSKFRYGRFVIPTFYKTHFLSAKQEHLIKRVSATLSQILTTAIRLYFDESHLTHVYRISPEAAELIKIDPGYSQPVVFSRFGALLEGMSLKFVKLSCDAPAGAAFADEIEGAVTAEKPLEEFFQEYEIRRTHRVQTLLDGLLGAYEQFGGFETPNIAIVDWPKTRTAVEMEVIRDHFESKGYKTSIADPRELQYRGGKLYHKNLRIHILYRRMQFDEILERLDQVQDMIKAYRDRAVCMVNPLRARLAGSKALLSILTNPEYDHFFTENENKVKREHLPWTRRLMDAEDFYGHKKIYLIDFLKDEKDSLVLKPSLGSGARNIVIGRETRDEDWNEAIDKALKGDWVVQEYVNVPMMTVPYLVNGKLDFAYKKFNFNALISDGKYSGGFIRLSEDNVINIARYGGLLPSLPSEHISERFAG